jgi:hypothetical protein
MVRGTKHNQIVLVVRAAIGTGFDVVQVHERRVSTAGHHAAPVIASHHFAAKRRRNRLRRTRALPHVGFTRGVVRRNEGRASSIAHTHVGRLTCRAPNVLRITLRHFHDSPVHRDHLTSSILGSPSAALANVQRHLIATLTVVARAAKNLARHQ